MPNIVVFIRSMAFFGDQLVTYPLLYQLNALYPDHRITVVAHDPVGQHYEHLPWVHHFVLATTKKARYQAIPPHTDMVIALHHSSEQYALICAAKRIKTRLGFSNKRLFDFLWTHTHKKDINEYIGLANLQLLRTLQPFNPQDAARGCMQWLARQKTTPVQHSDVVFMAGGGAGAFKRWGIHNYTALADHLKNRLGPDTTFTFVLGPAEENERQQLQQLARPDFRTLVSRPLADIADLCLNARLIVANDCGPSHIAQNSGTPYVGLFNEPNPEWFWARPTTRAVTPATGTIDIQAISVPQVLQACLEAMGQERPTPATP